MTFQLAVFGNPIAHSLSPKIHPIFAKQFDIDLEYRAILAPLGGFAAACQQFFEQGGYGCNITVPFKEDAYHFVSQHSPSAAYVKAVNTIFCKDGMCLGDNTDGQGLVNDLLLNKRVLLADKTIVILGAGGAARGILAALLQASPRQIIIVNRTLAKAQTILNDFGNPPCVQAISWHDLVDYAPKTDLLIDATSSAAIIEALPGYAWSASLFIYDLKYSVQETPLTRWARQQGYQASDGFGMLVEQAALAFKLWFDVQPKTQMLIKEGAQVLV